MGRKSKGIIQAVSIALLALAISYARTKWIGSTGFPSRVIIISVWLAFVTAWVLVKVKD